MARFMARDIQAGGGLSSAYSLSNNRRFADSFHTFAVEWEPNVVSFYCDGIPYKTRTPADLPAGKTWVFNKPFSFSSTSPSAGIGPETRMKLRSSHRLCWSIT